MSMYDQHVALGLCADSFVEQMRDFVSGDAMLLPSAESLEYLLSLMETGAFIFGFLDFTDEVRE